MIILRYTTDDDGVWLECDKDKGGCGWGKNLGWDPTPALAVIEAAKHRVTHENAAD